jgi:sigma-B regulation protein RsbU (phosphoserine phosphatase)
MSDAEIKSLKKRISELESEVSDREKDLSVFREELDKANAQLERLISRMNHELNIVSQIQKVLVPTELPHINGFEFSSKFLPGQVSGGDYFDIFEHEDRFRFGILVASSSGYGMSSLLLSVLLKLSGQMEARRGMKPNLVIQMIAQEIGDSIHEDESADLFYGVIDRRNFEMTYSKVGNILALMQNFSTGQLSLMDQGQPPMTKDYEESIQTAKVTLNPRDRLIFCTSGLLKVQSQKGEYFGQERLFKAILESPKRGVHELRTEILYQVERFSQGAEIERDITVIVSEVKDRVIKLARTEPKD